MNKMWKVLLTIHMSYINVATLPAPLLTQQQQQREVETDSKSDRNSHSECTRMSHEQKSVQCVDGYWGPVASLSPSEQRFLCDEHFRCSPGTGASSTGNNVGKDSAVTWMPPRYYSAEVDAAVLPAGTSRLGFTTKERVCEELQAQGLHHLMLFGDSHMRHISQALMSFLSGDYRLGGIVPSQTKNAACAFDHQLDASCRLFYKRKATVCNDSSVTISFTQSNNLDSLTQKKIGNRKSKKKTPMLNNSTVILLLFGNHAVTPSGQRVGVNNASIVSAHLRKALGGICPATSLTLDTDTSSSIHSSEKATNPPPVSPPTQTHQVHHLQNTSRIWWVSTHRRLKAYFPDEEDATVRLYNEQMRIFVEQHCQSALRGFVDVFNLTDQLVTQYPSMANKLKHDDCHWGFRVNLVKAVHILNVILA